MTGERWEFLMPSLGADMESGTVAEWLVKPGDRIRKGDCIAVIDTDKALIEAESFHTGVVEALLAGIGERLPVGTPLAVITGAAPAAELRPPTRGSPPVSPGEKTGMERRRREPSPAGGEHGPSWPHAPSPVTSPLVRHLAERHGMDAAAMHGTGPGGRVTRADVEGIEIPAKVKASPLARRLALELGVDLTGVHGTGRTGAVRADDVREAAARGSGTGPRAGTEQAVPGRAASAAGARTVGKPDLGRRQGLMRQAIARAMSRSNQEIPHYHLSTTVDMDTALAWLRERNRDLPVARRVLPAALLLMATARAAVEVPQLNGFWLDDAFVPGDAVHLGVAISLKGGGLIAPALHDAAGRDLGDLMAALKDLVARSRTGRLRGAEMTEATITVTNLGDQGVEEVHGVIHPPQVALVGFGKILERPWAVGGLLGVRPLVTVTLAADHRATDGYVGGRFLNAVDRLLSHPEEL
ncbi:pyruvate dehydrogenase E2 component (dihydrolipoamide acetyltransferase) [Streptosporangium canum]|uniref:Dihydrolipoamide acetyltransferase component of pyruvate dehydrogenase complex n=1 Tax=Streptosporangium canum TaxID=324952 RepID=A0A1I3V1B7_9ACTN|nr:2-oxo acid dehydrogenase subunit E2 [Streptosporangium canum]SFJ88156.1 pyruvate dehydrogenase E2 component (dihydrolipoamide acetyltransferase) [Streptosporangium canum]